MPNVEVIHLMQMLIEMVMLLPALTLSLKSGRLNVVEPSPNP